MKEWVSETVRDGVREYVRVTVNVKSQKMNEWINKGNWMGECMSKWVSESVMKWDQIDEWEIGWVKKW